MNLSALDFKNPNNSCQSLRLLAELVRQGEVQLTLAHLVEGDPSGHDVLKITMRQRAG